MSDRERAGTKSELATGMLNLFLGLVIFVAVCLFVGVAAGLVVLGFNWTVAL